MSHQHPPKSTGDDLTEGTLREQLAAYFLSAPPIGVQTPDQRREYLHQLARLGKLEQKEVLQAAGATRPLVWGNPVGLLQALLTAAQRMAAGLGQPLLLFPAKEVDIGFDTLLHPRLLSLALTRLLRAAVIAAPRQPVWVRLQEQSRSLALTVTGSTPFIDRETLDLVKECTRLHSGSLVHCDHTVGFSCGQVSEPPPGVRLYGCPSAEELLRDSLSPVWIHFYAGICAALSQSRSENRSASPSTASSDSEVVNSESSPSTSKDGSSASSEDTSR